MSKIKKYEISNATEGELAALIEEAKNDPNNESQYGLPCIKWETVADEGEYLVGTEEEASVACFEYIKDHLWAFSAYQICEFCGLDHCDEVSAIRDMQGELCENCNPIILAMIEHMGDGFDEFAQQAIANEGFGEILAQYDGIEIHIGNYILFRIN